MGFCPSVAYVKMHQLESSNVSCQSSTNLSHPCLITAFTVEKIDGIHVSIYGLGPLNWIVRRVLRALLRRHLRDFLEREGKDVVQQELQNATLASEGDNLFTMLPYLVMY